MAQNASDEPRDLVLANVNVSVATTPQPATSLQAFVPFFHQTRHEPFIARNAWRSAINGIKALKRLKMGVSNKTQLRSDLVVASGHKGRVLLWNADKLVTLNTTAQHGSNIVTQLIVTNTKVFGIVEKDQTYRSIASSDSEVYVWDLNTMELDTTLAGHEDRVACIAVDAENENHVLSGGNDKIILEWMLPNTNPIARYVGHTSAVSQVCFTFGRYFMSGSYDSNLMVWESTVKAAPRVQVSPNSRPPRLTRRASLTIEGTLQRTASTKAMLLAGVRECKPLHVLEGHMGQITHIDNMSEEAHMNMKRPSSSSSRIHKVKSDTAAVRTVMMISACNGGIVRCHSLSFEFADADKVLSSSTGRVGGGGNLQGSHSVMFPKSDFTIASAPTLVWNNKAHKALVKDVCWDGHVIVSASLSDGIAFYNTEAHVMNKIQFGTGVRHLAIDVMRRLVVCGCENGQISFYNYNGFYKLGYNDHYTYKAMQSQGTDDTVTLSATFQPHAGNITGMLLERSINGQWERLITTSSDSTFYVMDFDLQRDAKVYPLKAPTHTQMVPSLNLQHYYGNRITPFADCGSFMLANGSNGYVWDIDAMGPRMGVGKTLEDANGGAAGGSLKNSSSSYGGWGGYSTATTGTTMAGAASKALSRVNTPPPDAQRGPIVSCCTYYPTLQKLAVGHENGAIRAYPIMMNDIVGSERGSPASLGDGPGSPERTFANPNDHTRAGRREEEIGTPTEALIIEGGMFVRAFSEECINGLVVCCLERGSGPGANRSGGVALLNAANNTLFTGAYPLPLVPVSARLYSYEDKENSKVTRYIVLAQLRNGQILLLTCQSDTKTFAQQRVVLKEQFPYLPDREQDGLLPMPMPMFASLNNHYYPPRLNVMCVEKTLLRTMIVPTTSGDEVIFECGMPFFERLNITANLAEAIPVTALAPMRLSGYLAAVALQNGTVTLVTEAVEKARLPVNSTPDELREYRPIDILHNGGVIDHVTERYSARVQRRCYTKVDVGGLMGTNTGQSAPCTFITVSPHARMLGLGYKDGTIQLWDFATKRVCRRISAHKGSPIQHLSLFSREHRLLSISAVEMRFDTLYGRNVCEQKPSAEVAEEFA